MKSQIFWATNTNTLQNAIIISHHRYGQESPAFVVPNVLGLRPEDGIVRVKIIKSPEETKIWLVRSENQLCLFAWSKPKWIAELNKFFGGYYFLIPTECVEIGPEEEPVSITLKRLSNKRKNENTSF